MTVDEKAALKAQFGEHWFLRVLALDHEAIIAIPKHQATEEKEAAVELWHGSTVRLGPRKSA